MLNILLPTILLFIFGFFNLLGISPSLAFTQLFNFIFGLIIFFVIKKIGTHFFRINSRLFYWILVGILIVTFIVGLEIKGSKRWLDFYFFNFQGSELLKIFFILFLSHYLTTLTKKNKSASTFIATLGYFILPTIIIFKQPDLGNALVYVFIYLVMILFSNVPKKYLGYLLIFLMVICPLFWINLKDYQRSRLTSFLNPKVDQQNTAYNMTQAIITVGSGKFLGHGLGLGTQSRLYFLPENRTDFAFSSLVEQFGFVGGLTVISLYIILTISLFKKTIKYFFDKDENSVFKFYYCIGFLSFFVFQVLINIGMNLGILPVVGIALPLISYGGSSILTWMTGLALLP